MYVPFSCRIEYSNSKQCLDFWQGLVDYKNGGISKVSQGFKTNSFMIYEGRERNACRTDTIPAWNYDSRFSPSHNLLISKIRHTTHALLDITTSMPPKVAPFDLDYVILYDVYHLSLSPWGCVSLVHSRNWPIFSFMNSMTVLALFVSFLEVYCWLRMNVVAHRTFL